MGGVMLMDDLRSLIAAQKEDWPSQGREFKNLDERRDQRAGDGIVSYGQRLISKDGSFLYAGSRWQHDDLKFLAGRIVGVCTDDYWISGVSIWWPRYPAGQWLCNLDSESCATGSNMRGSRWSHKAAQQPTQRAEGE